MKMVIGIPINERTKFYICKSEQQQCVYCGNLIGKKTYAISMNNNTDELSLKKNLWLHINCVSKFCRMLNKHAKKQTKQMEANMMELAIKEL